MLNVEPLKKKKEKETRESRANLQSPMGMEPANWSPMAT
jgi:hypothetical protein